MVVVKLVAVKLVVVFAISVTVPEKSDAVADCHFVILPVCPLNVNVVEFVPVQTVAAPAIDPPTDVGLTVIVAEPEKVESQTPDLITAL